MSSCQLNWFSGSLFALFIAVGCGGGDSGGDGDGDGDGGGDGSGDVDAGEPLDTGLDVPPMEWTWMDVEGAECMNNTPTGMGVNINPDSRRLMIYLEGGGACFNAFTCTGVAHQNGFGKSDFNQFSGDFGSLGVFDRNDPDNPFKDWSFVFVPYCTGDIFAGSNPDGFGGRNQVGYDNMGAYIDILAPAFAQADHVVLTGSSAGGFGAAYNYDRVAQAFGNVPVTLLDDSGPALPNTWMTPCLQAEVREVWNLDATLPEGCAECSQEDGSGLNQLPKFMAEKYPDRNFGLITSTRDGVIRLFLGWGFPSCTNPTVPMPEPDFAEGVAALRTEMQQYSNSKMFTIESGLHVWLLESPVGSTQVGNVKLTDWIRDLVEDNESWTDVVP